MKLVVIIISKTNLYLYLMKNIKKANSLMITEAQILKKIQKSAITSPEQFQLIIQNLQEQNHRLLVDRQQLKDKVNILQERHRQILEEEKKQKKDGDPNKYYNRLKKQLEKNYKELDVYQKKIYNSMNKNAINIQLRQLVNKFFAIQQQIKQLRAQIIDQRKVFKKLQKSIKVQAKEMNRNQPQRQNLQSENKNLKKKISNLRIVEDLTEHLQIRVQDNMVNLKQKHQFFHKLNTLTVEQVKRQQIQSKFSIVNNNSKPSTNKSRRLKTEFLTGTNEYQTTVKKNCRITKQKRSITEIKQEKLQNIKKQVQQQQQKFNTIQIEFNQCKQIHSSVKLKFLAQQNKKNQIQKFIQSNLVKEYVEVSLQVNQQYEDVQPLRLQLVGQQQNSQQSIINDRMLLKDEKDVTITALMCYENKFGIVSIRASYSNGKITRIYEGIPQKYLKEKCKSKKIILKDPEDYLKWFKVYFNKTMNRIIRLQVFSNQKIKFESGKSKQQIFGDPNILPYKLDILANQAPVCLRSTYRQFKNNQWVLSSLGFQINLLS